MTGENKKSMNDKIKSILPLIEAKDNLFFDDLKKCMHNGLSTWLYGAGEGADNIIKRSKSIGICFAGMCVDREYYRPGEKVECLEDILSKEKINLVVAHREFDKRKLERYSESIGIIVDRDSFSGNYEADPTIMDIDYIKEHDEELTYIYNNLSDDKSRLSLLAYINQKISMSYGYLDKVKSDVQYFDADIIRLEENESLVDAGAYIGDTAESFLRELKKSGIKEYDAIYSFEPDKANYEKLNKLNMKNFYTFPVASSDKKEEVFFSSKGKGSSSGISEDNSGISIKTDTIDEVLEGKKVTFIKMDVEGYELASLKGAKRIIENNRPKMAICIYHKRQDLWEIQKYIESIVNDYQFYIRAYEDTVTELLLYALPRNKVKNKI